ncbi:PREDICTED: uncharacterized protein LOC104823942 [Tarenaya hassleriana]|uniref:uncharacterized protein LOC104823942 n=1 Tax=Tarenaya hassleriana TaxID=28532 RepID=UPI00053CA6F8|nr:PREDICTED: uncharacterized protein LOC104823942 [Tarenaya hassleriana]
MERNDDSSAFCPSFSSYSGDRHTEVADRVGREVVGESDDCRMEKSRVVECEGDNDDDVEFEFVDLRTDPDTAAASAYGGLLFPVFDQNLISDSYGVGSDGGNSEDSAATVTNSVRDLFRRDRDDPATQPPPQSSSSSSSDDELEGIPNEIYCPWKPARSTAVMSPSRCCKKSNSTGSSSTSTWSVKRWRIRDLLRRSRSDGRHSMVFLNSKTVNENERGIRNEEYSKKEKVSAHEKFYLRNRAIKEVERRKSYLPYKQHLFGL